MKKRKNSFLKRVSALLLALCCIFTVISAAEVDAMTTEQETTHLLLDSVVGRYKLNYTGNTNAFSKRMDGISYTYNDAGNWGNSSSATLTPTSGASGIKYAFLVWEVFIGAPNPTNPVVLISPDGRVRNIPAQYAVNDWRSAADNPPSWAYSTMYCMAANVTGIVQDAGYGTYSVCNIPYSESQGGESSASWQLVVVEEGDDFPVRVVNLSMGAEFRMGNTGGNPSSTGGGNYARVNPLNNGLKSKSTDTASGQIIFGASNADVHASLPMTSYMTTSSGGSALRTVSANTTYKAALYRNGTPMNTWDYINNGCIRVDLSDVSDIGNNADSLRVEVQQDSWTTFFLLGYSMDIAFPDFSSSQTTTVDSSTSVTVSGNITNMSPQDNTGIYNGNLTVDLDPGLVTDAGRCSVIVNEVPAAALTQVNRIDRDANGNPIEPYYQVQFYGGSIVNFMKGNTIKYTIQCSTNGTGKTRFDNSDSFNGFLRSDGVDTGHWINKAWTASSYAFAKFHVTVSPVPLAYGDPFQSLGGAGDYTFSSYVNAAAVMNPGYSFAGWTGTYTSAQNPYLFKMPAQDVILYANATDDPPKVTISGVSGSWNATADSTDVTSPWLRENVALTANASDYGSGLRKVAVASGGSTVKSVTYDGQQTGSAGYTVQKEGTTTYYGTATDRNGATGTSKHLTVKIDKTAPGGTARVNQWTEDDFTTTIRATINDTKDGATTDVSKVKEVHVEIWNEDDPSDKKTYPMNRIEGDSYSGKYSVSADLFQEFPAAAYLKVRVVATDNAGNTGEIPCSMPEGGHIQNFFITAYITRDDPNTSGWMGEWCTDPATGLKDIQDNDFISGQYGTMHIFTYGYVESVDIAFPDAFAQAAAKDVSLGIETVPAGGVNIVTDPAANPEVAVTDGGCGRSVEYNFKVPLYMHEWLTHYGSGEETIYVRTWFVETDTAHKGSNTCEAYPDLRVGGNMCVSIIDTIRTRLRDSESY